MKEKHTPGPWQVFKKPSHLYGDYLIIADSQGKRIGDSDASNETAVANASLIAAAPELLEACNLAEAVLAEHEQYDCDEFGDGEPSRESEAAQACRTAQPATSGKE
jgi:hypothetical protein